MKARLPSGTLQAVSACVAALLVPATLWSSWEGARFFAALPDAGEIAWQTVWAPSLPWLGLWLLLAVGGLLRWVPLRVLGVGLGPTLLLKGWAGLGSGGGQVEGAIVLSAQVAGALQLLLGLSLLAAGITWVVEKRRDRRRG